MTVSNRGTDVSIWMLGWVLVVMATASCASRSSGFDLENVRESDWGQLRRVGQEVGERFGFRSYHPESTDRPLMPDERTWIIASYSNRGSGVASIHGGRAHVEFHIFARAGDAVAEVAIIDYSNDEQTEYVRQIEDEFRRLISIHLPEASVAYTTHVVRTLPP